MTENNKSIKPQKSTYSQDMKNAKEEGKLSAHLNQKGRQVRKQQKKLSRLKTLLRFVLFLLLIFAIYGFIKLPGWYLNPDAFTQPDGQTVEIINNKIIPTPIIYNYLREIKVNKIPIFIMPVTPLKKELYKIPVIKNVYIRRYGFPARIKIIIRERIPMVVIKTDLKQRPIAFLTTDNIFVTNKNYMHLAESSSTLRILAKNPDFKNDWSIEKILFLEKVAKEIETYSKEKVAFVDMRNPNDVYVQIKSSNIRLGVLDSSVFERIKRIYTILPQIHNIDEKIKYIDLSWDKVNYLKINKDIKERTPQNQKENKKNDIYE